MKVIQKNILTIEDGMILQQVNCQGVMGSGLAKQIRAKYPRVFEDYKYWIESNDIPLGTVIVSVIRKEVAVACLFGQDEYGTTRQHTDYDALEKALRELACMIKAEEYDGQVYVPYNMGCGLGGGDWSVVEPLIEKYLPNAIVCKL